MNVTPSPRHSCGMTLDMKPYFYLLERGVDPVEAYRRTAGAIMKNVEVRTWYRGNKLGDAKEDEVRGGQGRVGGEGGSGGWEGRAREGRVGGEG